MASGTFSGLAAGALIGALIRGDVWAPTALPARPRAHPPTAAGVSVGPAGVGLRLPIRRPSR